MAEVWRAKYVGPSGFEKFLAIKKILQQFQSDHAFVKKFVAEAKLVAGLQHPNIVQVFDFGSIDQEYFIAMEYISGASVGEVNRILSARNQRWDPAMVFFIITEICKALGYAHNRVDDLESVSSVIHRDVSPQNILISFSGEVKVTDFGLAKLADSMGSTAVGTVLGKLAYMSPEQARQKHVDPRSDLFSLGLMLYEFMVGEKLFAGDKHIEVYEQVIRFKKLPKDKIKKLPSDVRTVLVKALRLDPEKRFQSAIEFETAVSRLAGSEVLVEGRSALSELVRELFQSKLHKDRVTRDPTEVTPHEGVVGNTLITNLEHVTDLEDEPQTGSESQERLTKSAPVPKLPYHVGKQSSSWLRRLFAVIFVGMVAGGSFWLGHNSDALLDAWQMRQGQESSPVATTGKERRGQLTQRAMPALELARPKSADEKEEVPSQVNAAPTVLPSESTTSEKEAVAPEATPEATPKKAEPSAPKLQAAATRAPAREQTPVPVGQGSLHVNARPWVSVWVDGKRIVAQTPLRDFALPAGSHKLRFVNKARDFEAERTVKIAPGQALEVYVDTTSGNVEISK